MGTDQFSGMGKPTSFCCFLWPQTPLPSAAGAKAPACLQGPGNAGQWLPGATWHSLCLLVQSSGLATGMG